jgi:hypothetical protein
LLVARVGVTDNRINCRIHCDDIKVIERGVSDNFAGR